MDNYYYTLVVLFCIASYFIVTDESIAKAVTIITKIIKFKCTNAYLYIWLHPKNPVFRYLAWRRSWKLAEELKKEYDK